MRKLLDCLNLLSQTAPKSQDAVRAGDPLKALELIEQIQFAASSAAALLKQELHSEFADGIDRVLLVEADAERRSEIAEQLRAGRFLVAEVSNGVEAIEYLYEMPQPDVLITDMAMEDCDGWELIKVARTSRVGIGVLMVAVTDYTKGDRPLPELDLLLKKNVNATELTQAVRQLIDRKSTNGKKPNSSSGGSVKPVIKNRAC